MARMSTQEVYADLMKSTFAPALRAAGMKGSSGRFELPSESHWALLGFQKSMYSTQGELRFTVNLTVVGKDAWAAMVQERPYLGAKPAHNGLAGGEEAVRIGQLVDGEDLWWHLHRGLDPSPVAAAVVAALTELAVPWLRSRV